MRLNQLRFFLAVLESGSIRAAARKLGVSPPAITKGLRQLEEEVHVRLLERTQHGVVTTPAGRAFARRAHAIESELRKAEEEFAQFAGGAAGSVAFGVGPTMMFLVVPEALKRFHQQYPEARVRIVEGSNLPMVRDQTLDFALGPRPVKKLESGLRFRPLVHDTLAIAARKGHPLGNERSLSPLTGAQWLASGSNWISPALDQVFTAAGLTPPRPIAQCDQFFSVVGLLAQSDMLAAVPSRLLASPLGRALLQQIPVCERMPSNTQGIFTRADASLTSLATAMTKVVTTIARQFARQQ